MNLLVPNRTVIAAPGDWRDPENYGWMTALPRNAWAWEFLRRNPDYRGAHAAGLAASPAEAVPDHHGVLGFGLLCFEDPDRDARTANALWQMKVCRDVLPLAASRMRPGTIAHTLKLGGFACRTTIYEYGVEDRKEVLFAQDGRALQLTVFGSTPLEEALLLTPALPGPPYDKSRLLAVRRLSDLVKHRCLRPTLYKRERQSLRLARVAQALDGWLANAPQRAIGAALFPTERVARDWKDPRNHLRDHVRRAIAYGRSLMTGKYRRFLH